MKYQSLVSFKKHLVNSHPNNLCSKYLVTINDDFERVQAIDLIVSFLPSPPTRLTGGDCAIKECLDQMHSTSLFGESVLVIDGVEKFGKKDLQLLASELEINSSIVVMGSRSKTILAPAIEKEGVILDLLEEKPWDKEKRLTDEILLKVKDAHKTIQVDAINLLFERLGVDAALLNSEVDKLICYVGDRSAITREDIFSISPLSKQATLWQTAEEVIWEGGIFPPIDSVVFHAMIPALRSQLHIGLSLATLIEERVSSDQWSRYLPKIWPKMLEKRSSQAARLGSKYFKKGLEKLFDLELKSRSTSTQYQTLLDLFRGELSHG